MRALLCILLLSPAVVFAGTYKCVVEGRTTYSGQPCGKNAQEVPNQIVVVPAQPVGASVGRTPVGNTAPAAAGASPAQQGAPANAAGGDANDCKARMQRYLDSQDCFNRFRRQGGAFTGDSSECPNVAYPSDCTNM